MADVTLLYDLLLRFSMVPRLLELYSDYSRQDVHGVFSPDTNFVPRAGTWGLQGIVDVPDRPGDYVFFVTFGQEQGTHQFDEFITEDGVLSWQSQPKQTLIERRIRDFIRHREEINNIHLFLRTDKRRDYTYLGRLKYLDHDPFKEKPVHFQWQILDWPVPNHVLQRMHLTLVPSRQAFMQERGVELEPEHRLIEVAVPVGRRRRQANGVQARRALRPDYVANQAANQELGLKGERLVIQMEQERLTAAGRPDLADKVRHVALLENDTAGYDVLSYEVNGTKRFIEVKTTRGSANADFFISASELVFASTHRDHYRLYRLYDYADEADTAKFFVLNGDIATSTLLRLTPTNYKVTVHRGDEE